MKYPKVYRRENRCLPGIFWYLFFEEPGEKIHAIDDYGVKSACPWTEDQVTNMLDTPYKYVDVTNVPEIQEALKCLSTAK